MIYTDGLHLISSENTKELHVFAARAGINSCWFHNPKDKNHPHYDLAQKLADKYIPDPRKLKIALDAGAIKVTDRELVIIYQERNKRNENKDNQLSLL